MTSVISQDFRVMSKMNFHGIRNNLNSYSALLTILSEFATIYIYIYIYIYTHLHLMIYGADLEEQL